MAELPREIREPLAQTADAQGDCNIPAMPKDGWVRLALFDSRFAQLTFVEQIELSDTQVTVAAPIRLKPARAISGKIIFADTHRPAPGVEVQAVSTDDSGVWASGVTDAQGQYALKQLRGGRYSLTASLPDAGAAVAAYVPGNRDDIAVPADIDRDGADFELVRGGRVRGRVVDRTTGKPVDGAVIMIGSRPSITGPDGSYAANVPPGPCTIGIQPRPGLIGDSVTRQLIVSVDQTLDADFTARSRPPTQVRGRAVDAQGRPMVGVEVLVSRNVEALPGDFAGVTDAAGEFSIDAEPGATIRARKGRWTTIKPFKVQSATVREPITLTLHKDERNAVSVRVTDEGGQPIGGAVIRLNAESSSNLIYDAKSTGADGACAFTSLSPDVKWVLSVEAKGFGTAKAAVQPETTVVLIKADSFVAGMVIGADGTPVADLPVRLFGSRSVNQSTRTDVSGHFRFSGVAAGDDLSLSAGAGTLSGFAHSVKAGTDNTVIAVAPTSP